jgi:adenine-specific DNA-methyltransferase
MGLAEVFQFPKPLELIKRVLLLATNKDSLVLDSFAGSGTTAHAVLNLNKQDGGNRKFILIEMEDYAETITAERVRRVIGRGEWHSPEGFDFYELGQPLFIDGENLNEEEVGEDKIREYIYYTETKQHLECLQSPEHKYLLDTYNDTAYYFYYEKERVTTLDNEFLASIKIKAEQYVIYADNCLLTKDFMQKSNIIFKKIPRDVRRF